MNKDKKGQTTLIERMGFNDKDFKTSKHDEICLWLAKKENIYGLFNKIHRINKEDTFHLNNFNYRFIKKGFWDSKNLKCYKYKERSYEMEVSDVLLDDQELILLDYHKFISLPKQFNLGFEFVINNNRNNNSKFVVGFIDLVVSFEFRSTDYFIETSVSPMIFVEVKSVMPSFGEIVREINYYKNFNNGIYVVVAPDCSFEQELKDQGIYFYKYDNNIKPQSI